MTAKYLVPFHDKITISDIKQSIFFKSNLKEVWEYGV